MAFEPGVRLDEYVLLRPLGSGGMGEVWLARDSRLERRVALKLLPSDLTRDPVRIARFEQEARVASSLNHPNVCTILSLGHTPDMPRYIAMEYIEGETLRTRLSRARPTIRESVDIATQIGSALAAAHAAGVVHRDIKPENVVLRPDGVVKVLDFGLAKLTPLGAELSADCTRLRTDVGTVMGTVAYMSPEQARGHEVDGRTDVWSLGVVLWEMLTGRPPFGGQSPTDVLAAILEHDAPSLSEDVPPELQRIVGKALRKDREYRYQVVKDLQLDVESVGEVLKLAANQRGSAATRTIPATGDTPAAHPTNPIPASFRAAYVVGKLGEHRGVAAVAAIAIVVAAVATGGWWNIDAWRQMQSPSRTGILPALTRLTFDAGLQTDVVWSPDGRAIAYASDTGGNFDIWVQRVEGGDPVQLTKSRAQDTQPTWSPDGRTIVFRSEREDGGLFVVPASGGAERRLTSFGVRPKWAPDGSRILFAANDVLAGGVASPLYSVRLDGKPPEQVLQPFLKGLRRGLGGMLDWNWYPDSRHVSILGVVPDQGVGVYTVPLEGGSATLLKETAQAGRWTAFAWASPTTLLVDCDSKGVHSVVKLTLDSKITSVLTSERITLGDGWEPRFSLSLDGRRLAFTISTMSQRLWALPLDTATGRTTGDGQPVSDTMGLATTSDLTRDGGRVAYTLTRAGTERTELWTTDLRTNQSQTLSRDDQRREFPQWSHDATRLAYRWVRRTPDGSDEMALAVRRTDTNDEEIIATPRSDTFVTTWDWSPDGQWILASSGVMPFRGAASLGLWPLAGAPHAETAVKELTADSSYAVWQAKFSPDGRWICFAAIDATQPGSDVVFVIPSAGADRSRWTALTSARGWADKPRWSSDGKLIYFVQAEPFFNVWAVRFDGATGKGVGAPFQVTAYDSPRHQLTPKFGAAEIGVSAERLIVTIMEQTGNIWMLDGLDH
jgi:eukaryotic-like serine/threonine-protein kinase